MNTRLKFFDFEIEKYLHKQCLLKLSELKLIKGNK